jgi:methyl-accepting chemotaxis protein
VILLISAFYNYRAFSNVAGELVEIADADLPLLKVVTQVHTTSLQELVQLERVIGLKAAADDTARAARNHAAAEFEGLSKQFDADLAAAEEAIRRASGITSEYEGFDEELRALQKEKQELTTLGHQAVGFVMSGNVAELDRLVPQVEKDADDIEVQVKRMVAEVERFTGESMTAAASYEGAAKTVSTGLSAAGTLLAVIVSVVFVNGLRRSVTDVTNLAVHISDGNLRQEKLAIKTTDEMGQLGLIFNGMLVGLRENVTQTRSAAESLNAAVAEIVASVKEQAAGTTEQAAAVQETTATMEEISQSGNQIAERSRHVAAAAEATSTAANQGLDAAENGTKVMDAIQQQTETVAENIITLSEKTQAVGEIIATVTDIAEQSNLLALNAAIEAAAAGEQGRTFAVVANEIKNLADQAKDATGKVRTILSDIQKGINTSVMLTEEVVKRVDSGKKQADVVERTIKHMAESLNSSIQAFQQITAATGQQQIGFDQVTQALKNIRQAADQTAVSTNQLEKASINLTGLGQQLTKNVERFRT